MKVMCVEPGLKKRRRSADLTQILTISIYVASSEKRYVPQGQRAEFHFGSAPDLERILEEEREGVHINRVQNETGKRDGMAVLGKTLLSTSARLVSLTFGSFSDWLDPGSRQRAGARSCEGWRGLVRARVPTSVRARAWQPATVFCLLQCSVEEPYSQTRNGDDRLITCSTVLYILHCCNAPLPQRDDGNACCAVPPLHGDPWLHC